MGYEGISAYKNGYYPNFQAHSDYATGYCIDQKNNHTWIDNDMIESNQEIFTIFLNDAYDVQVKMFDEIVKRDDDIRQNAKYYYQMCVDDQSWFVGTNTAYPRYLAEYQLIHAKTFDAVVAECAQFGSYSNSYEEDGNLYSFGFYDGSAPCGVEKVQYAFDYCYQGMNTAISTAAIDPPENADYLIKHAAATSNNIDFTILNYYNQVEAFWTTSTNTRDSMDLCKLENGNKIRIVM